MSFGTETKSIVEHIQILANAIGIENPMGFSTSGETTRPSEYEIVQYSPPLHDPLEVKQQIISFGVDEDDEDDTGRKEDMRMWLDAARLCAFCAQHGIDLREAYSNPRVDVEVVRMVAVLNRSQAQPLFDSRVFRVRFSQPMYRPWLYLVSYFTDVWVCQQWQRGPALYVVGVLVAGPVIPEWFVKKGEAGPVLLRNLKTLHPIPVLQTACVYRIHDYIDSYAGVLLLWMYLTHCSADKSLRHVLFPGRSNEQDSFPWSKYVGVEEAEYARSSRPMAVCSREFPEERFFPTYLILDMLEEHHRPGFHVEARAAEEAYDYSKGGKLVIPAPITPQSLTSLRKSSPRALNVVPSSISWSANH